MSNFMEKLKTVAKKAVKKVKQVEEEVVAQVETETVSAPAPTVAQEQEVELHEGKKVLKKNIVEANGRTWVDIQVESGEVYRVLHE
jgi:hypothetical protein